MTIRDLEIFVEVCKQMNMSKAAQALFISPSSVSQAISELEQEYNTKLFERLAKKLYLTSQGEILLFHAKQLLYNLEQMNLKMKNSFQKEVIRIGSCTTIGYSLIYSILDEYENLCPSLNVQVEIGNSSYLEQKLLSSDLDLAIVQMISPCKELTYTNFLDDKLMLVCHPENPLAGETISIEQLCKEKIIAREQGSRSQKLLQDVFNKADKIPKATWVCNSIDSIKQAVKHHKGIALLSQYLIQDELKRQELSVLYLRECAFSRKFYLASHKDKHKTQYMKVFEQLCSRIAKIPLPE